MIQRLLETFELKNQFVQSVQDIERTGQLVLHGLGGASDAFWIASLARHQSWRDRLICTILPDEETAQVVRGDLAALIGEERVALFPERDTSPYEQIDSHVEVRSRRIETIDQIEQGWRGVIVASAGAVHDPTAPCGLLPLVALHMKAGQSCVFDDCIRMLAAKGFRRERMVLSPGQFAVRGGILDVFPFSEQQPVRIEFWGDTIESLRTFSTDTQRSLKSIDSVRIIPPDELIIEAGIDPAHERRIDDAEQMHGIDLTAIREMVRGGDRPNGAEQYIGLIFGESASLLSYLDDRDAVIMIEPDAVRHTIEKRLTHAETVWYHMRQDEPHLPPPTLLYQSTEAFITRTAQSQQVIIQDIRPKDTPVSSFGITASRDYHGNLDAVRQDITTADERQELVHITCDNSGQADRLRDLLEDLDAPFTIDITRMSAGFHDPESGILLLTDHEIFGRRHRRPRHRRYKEGVPIPDHRDLQLGDFVVHVDYGIGRYMGLKRITAGGATTDCLMVQYGGDDKLFVPVEQLKRLKKFSAEEGVVPVVNKLGGTAWERLKEKTKKSIQRLAEDLLKLYAERKAYPGFAFAADESMIHALEDSFMYEETPDQKKSWAEVRVDMSSQAPMERLICGDVGFGKTEIAIRAAFLAAINGKQVAVLVPTTILAEQHEDTFRERLADFPVTVASLSRFKTRKEQRETVERLMHGEVDIIIGTHRLLSDDIHLKELGLLIIDEEQRFGVRHKERIKSFRKTVDVLSMSATPIPRTLNMSLLGARDISFINTPPPDRYAVHTEVIPFEEKYIVDAVMQEIDRGGQVFFVHNRVQSIESMAAYLRRLMPSVTFCVAHGQMRERELEQHMRDFYHGKYQVLVSTMIIENGLDIPAVNTIIINRADTFGLSQLYQLRGRVGRSSVRAYAYLLVPPKVPLTPIARKRLHTIEELTSLGSGFNIAMRDLEFRGAGNILGTQQSGFITAVGFDLYTELLHETIAGLRGETIEKPPEVDIQASGEAFIPESYIDDARERVNVYRRLAETLSSGQVTDIEDEVRDRFGAFPEPVTTIFTFAYIRHYAGKAGIDRVSVDKNRVDLHIPTSIDVSRKTVERMVSKSPVKLHFSFEDGMRISFDTNNDGTPILEMAKKVLQALSG